MPILKRAGDQLLYIPNNHKTILRSIRSNVTKIPAKTEQMTVVIEHNLYRTQSIFIEHNPEIAENRALYKFN